MAFGIDIGFIIFVAILVAVGYAIAGSEKH